PGAASLRSRSAGRARVWRVRLGSQPDVERHRTDRLAVRRQPERVGDDETFADLAFHHGPLNTPPRRPRISSWKSIGGHSIAYTPSALGASPNATPSTTRGA